MERWKVKQAVRAKGQSRQELDSTGGVGTDGAETRGGWTMAAALIAYKTRELEARRRPEPGAEASHTGYSASVRARQWSGSV